MSEDMHVRIRVFTCKHTYTFLLESFLKDYGIFVKQEQNGSQVFLQLPQFSCTNYTQKILGFYSQPLFVGHKRNRK